MKRVDSLCYVLDGDRILLGMKKRGFGLGLWNGFGGKSNPGETIVETAKRELEEESGLVASSIQEKGVITFSFEDGNEIEVHVFVVNSFSGEVCETEEMKPQWFDIANLPFDRMWASDRYWLPLLLSGDNFFGRALFAEDGNLISHNFEIIN